MCTILITPKTENNVIFLHNHPVISSVLATLSPPQINSGLLSQEALIMSKSFSYLILQMHLWFDNSLNLISNIKPLNHKARLTSSLADLFFKMNDINGTETLLVCCIDLNKFFYC